MDNEEFYEELFFMSMWHFRTVIYSSDYTEAQKQEEFELFKKDYEKVKEDPILQKLYKATIGEWEHR